MGSTWRFQLCNQRLGRDCPGPLPAMLPSVPAGFASWKRGLCCLPALPQAGRLALLSDSAQTHTNEPRLGRRQSIIQCVENG